MSRPAQREQLERQQKLYDFASGYRMVLRISPRRLRLSLFKKKIYEVPSTELQKVMSTLSRRTCTGDHTVRREPE